MARAKIGDNELDPRYFVETAVRVLDVLESFTSPHESLSITEVARRTNLTYSSAFRLLYTLERRGYVLRPAGRKQYLLSPARKKYRIGYAGLRATRFHQEVTASIVSATQRFGVRLLTRFNKEFDLSRALLNADQLIAEKVDLLVEYQYHETASHLIAAKCHEAGIQAIGINFAQPGAYYFGGNNYQTGVLAGKFLVQYAAAHWRGRADACLVLPAKGLSSTQEARQAGLTESLRRGILHLGGPGIVIAPQALTVAEGRSITGKFIREIGGRNRHIMIAALTDHLALGAERAVLAEGIAERAVIVGQGGGRDARMHLATGGPFKASVAFFSECYGESVLSLAVRILNGEKAPLTSYTNHVVLTAKNLKDYYPDERYPRVRVRISPA